MDILYWTEQLIIMCIQNNYTYVWLSNKHNKKAHYRALQLWCSNFKTKTIDNIWSIQWEYVIDNIITIYPWLVAICE